MPFPQLLEKYPKGMRLFVKRLHNRVEDNKNALIIVVGKTGSGKSYATEGLMTALYEYRYGKLPPKEYIEYHTVFRALEFMKKLNSPEKLVRGDAWNWDEAGVDAGHREHASVKNKILGWLAQTFRNLGQIVFFTTPTVRFIDASIRKLFHFYAEAQMIDKKQKICYLRTYEMYYNPKIDKLYYYNLRFLNGKKGVNVVRYIGVPKIADEVLQAYETKKTAFTRDLNIRIQKQLERIEQKELGKDIADADSENELSEKKKKDELKRQEITHRLETDENFRKEMFEYAFNRQDYLKNPTFKAYVDALAKKYHYPIPSTTKEEGNLT